MHEPRLRHVQCLSTSGLHRMAYWEWGDPRNARVLVCAHGLTRQGRDFDTLARAMCEEFRVVCPDVVGRGQSDWLADPRGYQVPAYVADMVTLVARLDTDAVSWFGTSMGGLIGMGLTALPKSPVVRLVLNDVGPALQPEAIKRIGGYVGVTPRWASLDEAADYLLSISAGFGPHTREQWLELTRPQLKRVDEGDTQVFVPRADPGIAVPFRAVTPEAAAIGEAMLWAAYDAIRCPTLLLRGADSDLLSRETAESMTQRGPKARLVEFAGVGHAPTIVAPDQVAAVREFLLAP
jgi:pimeloyl-ACP methyl ester carboxylesterase